MGKIQKMLETFSQKAFAEADLDKSGSVDINELFIAILLVYDRINYYSPVYIAIPKKTQVEKMMKKYDKDHNESLELDEFKDVVKALFAFDKGTWRQSVWFRLAWSISIKLALVPLITYLILLYVSPLFPLLEKAPQASVAGLVDIIGVYFGGKLL